MSNKDLLDNIKKLREMTGVGFKDCKIALDETKGNIEKSIEFLRQYSFNNLELNQSSVASTIIEHSFKEFKFKGLIFSSIVLILHSVLSQQFLWLLQCFPCCVSDAQLTQ